MNKNGDEATTKIAYSNIYKGKIRQQTFLGSAGSIRNVPRARANTHK